MIKLKKNNKIRAKILWDAIKESVENLKTFKFYTEVSRMKYKNNDENNRVSIRIPFSVLEIIERIMENRINDGEANVTRHAVAVKLLKLGARIEKRKLDNIDTGANPFDSRIESQLSFIANSVIKTSLQVERFFSIFYELNQISPDLMSKIARDIKLSDKEKELLKRLFVEVE